MATASETIQIYNAVLQRDPTDAELAAFVAASSTSAGEAQQIDVLVNSSEARADVYPFIQLYQAIFGRVPDAAGLDFWVGQLRAGVTLQTIVTGDESRGIDGFANSPEFEAAFGADVDPTSESFITALYQNFLGREPDAEGLAFYTGLGENATVGDVVIAFTSSPEFGSAIDAQIEIFLTRAAEGTQDYEGSVYDINDDGVVDDLDDPDSDPDTGTVTLTTGTDIETANVFNAPLVTDNGIPGNDTLNSTDELTGIGTNPTLNATVNNSTGAPVAPTLNGIETINYNDATAGGAILDLQNATGVKNININSGAGTPAITNIALMAGMMVSVTNTTGNTALSFETESISGDEDSLDLVLTNATGGVGITPAIAGDIETLNITSEAAEGVTNAGLTALAGFETINIDGTGDLDLTVPVPAVPGAPAGLNVRASTLDATTFTGDLTAIFAAGDKTVTGGEGDDVLNFASAGNAGGAAGVVGSGAVTVNAGAGNDTVNMGASLGTTDSLDGGEDDDVLVVSAGLGSESLDVTNFETLRLEGPNPLAAGFVNGTYDLDMLEGSMIDRVEVRGQPGGTTTISNLDSGGTVALQGRAGFDPGAPGVATNLANITVEVTDAATNLSADTLNLDVGRVAGGVGQNGTAALPVGTVTVDDVEIINVTVAGTNTQNVVGTNSVNALTALSADSLVQLNVDGDDSLHITTPGIGGTTLVSVDASEHSGGLNAAFGAGAGSGTGAQAITGVNMMFGGGDDAIGGGANIDRVDLGGGDDTYTSANAANTAGDIITLGDGSDGMVFLEETDGGALAGDDNDLGHRITDFSAGSGGDALVFDASEVDPGGTDLTTNVVFDIGDGAGATAAVDGDVLVLAGQSFGSYTDAEAFINGFNPNFEGVVVYRDSGQGAVRVFAEADTANTADELALATLENLTTVGQLDSLTAANFEFI